MQARVDDTQTTIRELRNMNIKFRKFERKPTFLMLAGLSILALAACQSETPQSNGTNTEWLAVGNGVGETRYSDLSDINADNIDRLGLAWMFRDFVVRGRVHRGNQGTPLVIGRNMYFTGPWSVVYAVDATTGESVWKYDPGAAGAWARNACCDVNNKGVAVTGDKLIVGVVDGYLDALDIETGERLWRADTLIDRTRAYTVTGAPRIAGDVVVIGNGGADMGTRGYFSAYSIETGELAWRFFVVPGDPALGDEHAELTAARETWGDDARWDLGLGGNPYDGMVYDPDLDLIYVGTSNGVPHPTWLRDPTNLGENLYLSSILAVEAKTGRLRWHYQTTPSDDWDFGSTQNLILADLEIDGAPRKVVMQAPKNGFFYVIDRVTGELLSAEPFTTVTWASHVDMDTGKPVVDKSLSYEDGPKIVWPSVSGGHNWQPMAFNKENKLVYIPVLEAPMKYLGFDSVEYQPGSINEGKGPPLMPPFDAEDAPLLEGQPEVVEHSMMKAWDPVAQKTVWSSEPQSWWSGGVLAVGELIVQGTVDGLITVFDANSGKILKQIQTGVAILAPPMTYRIDGVQYIAVLAGLGGSESAYFPRASAAQKYQNPETLFVFKLDGGDIPMPPPLVEPEIQPLPEPREIDAETLATAEAQYFHHCARCHSWRGSEGAYPNLWNMTPAGHASFNAAVLDGAFSFAGMAPFADVLSKEEVDAIYAYIVNDTLAMQTEGEEGEPEKRELGF